MGRAKRPVPEKLHSKLLAIRISMAVSGEAMAELLSDSEIVTSSKDVYKWEAGEREPNLISLLRYARIAKVSVDVLIDDHLSFLP